MRNKRFYELDPGAFKNRSIILDVDGTLVPDWGALPDERTMQVFRALTTSAKVFLCSNAEPIQRLDAIAKGTAAVVVRSSYKKPDRRVVNDLSIDGIPLVIGDKFYTDGLLALSIKGEFIRVARLYNPREKWFIFGSYVFDALIGRPVFYLRRLFP